MAVNGLSTFLFSLLNEDVGSYADVTKLAGAISYKENLTRASAAVHADNVKKWEDNSVTGGKLTLGVDDDAPEIFAPLLGRGEREVTVNTEIKKVYVGNSNDISAPVGFGFIEYGRNEKKGYYQVNFYPKVTFAPYDKEAETKKENTDYKTPSVEGTIYNIANGDYKYERRCDTLLEALEVLYALFGKDEVPPEILAQLQLEAAKADETK